MPLDELKPTASSHLVDLSRKPLTVLISDGTFSAGEELAYGLQQSRRAILIGTQTKGGNHFTRPEPLLTEDGTQNQHFYMLIPSALSINPISGTNFEDGPQSKGKVPGVRPDYVVPEGKDALNVAADIRMAYSQFGQASNTARSRNSTTAVLLSRNIGGVEVPNESPVLSATSPKNSSNTIINLSDKDTKQEADLSTNFNPTPFNKKPKPKGQL